MLTIVRQQIPNEHVFPVMSPEFSLAEVVDQHMAASYAPSSKVGLCLEVASLDSRLQVIGCNIVGSFPIIDRNIRCVLANLIDRKSHV